MELHRRNVFSKDKRLLNEQYYYYSLLHMKQNPICGLLENQRTLTELVNFSLIMALNSYRQPLMIDAEFIG